VTDTNGDVDLWLFPSHPASPYVLTATPPTGSGFAITNLSNVAVVSHTSVTITLAVPVTLSGQVKNELGNGLPNQGLYLAAAGTSNYVYQTTDASGNYSYQVAPGDYTLQVNTFNDPSANLAAPRWYNFYTQSSFSLSQTTVIDITLPAKRLSVHVQDPLGNPVAAVGITSNNSYNDNLMLGTFAAVGSSGYFHYYPPAVTDTNGDVDLWLFPSHPASPYVLTATPPTGSGYVTFNIHDLSVVSDQTLVIVLQFAEPPPPNACPLSQGYWKNHAEFWPVSSLVLGSQTYTQWELRSLLTTPVNKDASLILAHQLIAAELNIALGSDPAPVSATIAAADAMLASYSGKLPYKVKVASPKGQQMTTAATTLDGYSNGLLTPKCDFQAPTLALTRTEREIQTLRKTVSTMVAKGALSRDHSSTLDAELLGAKLAREKKQIARLALRAFGDEVSQLMRTGVLTSTDGRILIDAANQIERALGN
jgi:hypothetical protein